MSDSKNTSAAAVSARLHRAGFTTVHSYTREGIRVSRSVMGEVHIVVDHNTERSALRVADLVNEELQGWEGYTFRRHDGVHFYVKKSQPAAPAADVAEAAPAPAADLRPGQPVTDGTGRVGIITDVPSPRGTRARQVAVMWVGAPYTVYEQRDEVTVTGPLFALEPDAPATYREALAAEHGPDAHLLQQPAPAETSMKISEAEGLRLLSATEERQPYPNRPRALEMSLGTGRLPVNPGNQWAVDLVKQWRAEEAAPADVNTRCGSVRTDDDGDDWRCQLQAGHHGLHAVKFGPSWSQAHAADPAHDMRAAWQFVVDSYDGQGYSPVRGDWNDADVLAFVAEHHVDGPDAFKLEQPAPAADVVPAITAVVVLHHTAPWNARLVDDYRTRWAQHNGRFFKVSSDSLDGVWWVELIDAEGARVEPMQPGTLRLAQNLVQARETIERWK